MKRLKDFSRSQIKKVATEYATSDLACNHSYFEREYDISDSTFYNLLDKAIIESIVDEDIARKIGNKAAANASTKAGESAGIRSKLHNSHLMMKRKNFKFSKVEAKKMAIKYAKSSLSKEAFCKSNCITKKLFDDALVRAIAECWIDDKTYEEIKSKALQNNGNSSSACELFKKLDAMRNKHKEERR